MYITLSQYCHVLQSSSPARLMKHRGEFVTVIYTYYSDLIQNVYNPPPPPIHSSPCTMLNPDLSYSPSIYCDTIQRPGLKKQWRLG
jgi:hypothetical protein